MLFKGAAKDAFAGKSGVKADILYRKPGIFKQIFCGADPGMDQIFVGSEAGFLFKGADKVVLA